MDKVYQRIGEFVVSLQWLESRLREIGWLILEPEREEWPPQPLRDLGNHDLVYKVGELYVELIDSLNIDDQDQRKSNFKYLLSTCHEMRRYRNNLLHSAFIQLKACQDDEVLGTQIKSKDQNRPETKTVVRPAIL